MAQKINTVGLRLKNRLNWDSSWYAMSTTYSKTLHKNLKLKNSFSWLLKFLRFLSNDLHITKDSKKYQIVTKMLPFITIAEIKPRKRNVLKRDDYSSLLRKNYLDNQLSAVKFLHHSLKTVDFCGVNLNLKQQSLNIMLFPKIISWYLATQLKNPLKLKNKTFSKNLNQSILIFINSLLRFGNLKILGLKIGFFGKWQKTRNGKKQCLNFYWGKLKYPTVSNVIFFSSTPVTTKFGVCNIKVWISLKKKSFLA